MVNIYLCAYCSLCATASASVSTRIGTCSSFVLAFSLWFCQTLTHSHASRPGWVGGARIETLERAHFTSLFLRGCGAEDDSVACACLPAPHHVVGTCNHIENQTKSKKLAFSGMATRDSAGMNDAGATVTARWDPKTGYRNRKYDARDICVCVAYLYTFSFVRWLHVAHESGASRLNRREMRMNGPQAHTVCALFSIIMSRAYHRPATHPLRVGFGEATENVFWWGVGLDRMVARTLQSLAEF